MKDHVIEDELGKEEHSKEDNIKVKTYTYDEALELALGNGFYNISLLATLTFTIFSMILDMFGFCIIVSFVNCDMSLDLTQKSILLSIPFSGPIIMSYAWGYISDTKGRKISLMIGLTGGFVMSSLCAFAPNWIVLVVFKIIGTCFYTCAQSLPYTLLGESCCERVKGTYMLIMSSLLLTVCFVYFTLGYFIGNLTFAYDLGFIVFVPWRLLSIVLALPMCISSIALMFFYESPKFLINAGREDQALEVLRCISRRNGNKKDYPVQKLVLNEEGNVMQKDTPLLRSLLEQTAPLFKPPFLLWNLALYYLTFVAYASAGSLYIWMPFLANAIVSGGNSSSVQNEGFCEMITYMNSATSEDTPCSAAIDVTMVYATCVSCSFYFCCNIAMSWLASRKRTLVIAIFLLSILCSVVTVAVPHSVSGYFYFGALAASLEIGLLAAYYVDLFPTSFRGMASNLGVMVARFSNVVGINIIGPFILSNCSATFYGFIALFASGILTAFLLPPDRPKKVL